MDPFTIHGTLTALNQRQTTPAARRIRSNARQRVSSPKVPIYRASQNTKTETSDKAQSSKLSLKKMMTLPVLTELLEVWKDPDSFAQVDKAKEKITNCFNQRLDTLDLSSLGLTSLPDVFGGMQNIHYLSIANNYFSDIPLCLTKLTSLKRLNISNNILKEIPDLIKEFKYLECFNSECNQLQKISEELGRLPRLKILMLAHNRIMNMPQNIHHIRDLQIEDQVLLASFGDFSPEFEAQWEENFNTEAYSGYFELWLARYEEILRLPKAKKHRQVFKQRIGALMEAMVNDSDFRKLCYEKAYNVVSTSHNGILFALYELEAKLIEQLIIELKLSDEEVRQEVERAFNFYRLQELAQLHGQQFSLQNNATPDEEIVDGQESVLFFYISPENTLEMPSGKEIPRLMYQSDLSIATDDNVRRAIEGIRQEKEEHGPNYLIHFILDKEYWIEYLSRRYSDFIREHTQVFMDQMEEIEAEKDQVNEYDYLIRMNALLEEKNESEQRLYYQLTKNIVIDS